VTASAAATSSLRHRDARERYGEPDDWEGSVNDPVTREEHGIRWNEKWIYYLDHGERRHIYWHRYACRGIVRLRADGTVERELVPGT
jgi:hypothetical protein